MLTLKTVPNSRHSIVCTTLQTSVSGRTSRRRYEGYSSGDRQTRVVLWSNSRLYSSAEETESLYEVDSPGDKTPVYEDFVKPRLILSEKEEGFEERLVELRRVATTTKGGRDISFRAVVVVGNGKGTVGVGNATAKEIPLACKKAQARARKSVISFPLDPVSFSFPHRQEVKFCGARVLLNPGRDGTGVIAGSSVRDVLEVAGVQNGYGKIIRSKNLMNNAKATVKALSLMRSIQQVADLRGVSLDYLFGRTIDPRDSACPPEDESEIEPWMISHDQSPQ